MKKILFLTDSEALKNLVAKNQNYEFEFFADEKNLQEFLEKSSENLDYSALLLDQIITQTNFINSLNLAIISFVKEQENLNQIHFLNKPVHIIELFSAIESLTTKRQDKIFNIGDCEIDLESRFIKKTHDQSESEIKLTELEAKILDFFLDEFAEKTKVKILQKVWGYKNSDQMADTGIAEVTINKLRKKLKELGIDELINFKLN